MPTKCSWSHTNPVGNTFSSGKCQKCLKQTASPHTSICRSVTLSKKMQEFAASYAEAAPHHIQEAEEKASKESWKSPISFKEWMDMDYERRWKRYRDL
jgi:uncharacterized protein